MNFVPNKIYHVYNQGNNQQKIFFNEADYLIFLNLYRRLFPGCCSTMAWCLMPNHFHFMLHTDDRTCTEIRQGNLVIDPIANSIRKLLSGYARIFNNRYKQSGSVFRQKTKAKCLSDLEIKSNSQYLITDYYINCFNYIHQNPLKAGLVKRMEEWEFSSYRDYAGIRKGTLCSKELAWLHCNYDPVDYMKKSMEIADPLLVQLFNC